MLQSGTNREWTNYGPTANMKEIIRGNSGLTANASIRDKVRMDRSSPTPWMGEGQSANRSIRTLSLLNHLTGTNRECTLRTECECFNLGQSANGPTLVYALDGKGDKMRIGLCVMSLPHRDKSRMHAQDKVRMLQSGTKSERTNPRLRPGRERGQNANWPAYYVPFETKKDRSWIKEFRHWFGGFRKGHWGRFCVSKSSHR